MKVLQNTLRPVIDRWDDPGDYPSNAGAGPLPSYYYANSLKGRLLFRLEPDEVACYVEDEKEFLHEHLPDCMPDGIVIAHWTSIASLLMNNTLLIFGDSIEIEWQWILPQIRIR